MIKRCLTWSFLLTTILLSAQNEKADITTLVNDFCKADGPGISVIAVRGNDIIYHDARGMADMEMDIPLSTASIFQIGSVSKQFTAVAIMQLAEQRRLDIDDVITRYLPDFPMQGQLITVRHLLNHTSGIHNYTDKQDFFPDHSPLSSSLSDVIDYFKNDSLDFVPGTDWNYSNSGYVLLGAIIEQVSGQSCAAYMKQHLFEPAGMTNTYFGGQSDIIKNRAHGYEIAPTPSGYINRPFLADVWAHAAGAIISTTEDLYKWTKAVNEYKLLSKPYLDQCYLPAILPNGTNTHYGFGWNIDELKGHRTLEHSGGINGFVAYELYIPDAQIFVAFTCNVARDGGTNLCSKIAAILLKDPYDFPTFTVDEKTMASYVGIYKNDAGEQRYISLENGKLHSQRGESRKFQIRPFAPDQFVFDGELTTITFQRTKKKITGLTFDSRSQGRSEWIKISDKLPVIEKVNVSESILQTYVGTYTLVEGFDIVVSVKAGKIYAEPTGQAIAELEPRSNTQFAIPEAGAKISFVTSTDGKVNELVLEQAGQKMIGKKK